jgi:hypothetical protein
MLPFQEDKIAENTFIRIFPEDTPELSLKWHWDEEDRIIEPVGPTNWLFQFDNQLPTEINNQIFIPKGVIHRIIKGTGELKIKVIKINTT